MPLGEPIFVQLNVKPSGSKLTRVALKAWPLAGDNENTVPTEP